MLLMVTDHALHLLAGDPVLLALRPKKLQDGHLAFLGVVQYLGRFRWVGIAVDDLRAGERFVDALADALDQLHVLEHVAHGFLVQVQHAHQQRDVARENHEQVQHREDRQ